MAAWHGSPFLFPEAISRKSSNNTVTFIIMSFGSSQMTTQKLLLRRYASAPGGDDAPAPTSTEPLLDPELSSTVVLSTPAHTHKRKTSDTLNLGELDISPETYANSTSSATYYSSISPIELQGTTSVDLDDENNTSNQRCRITEHPYLSTCQLFSIFAICAALASIHSVATQQQHNQKHSFIRDGGFEAVGGPREAQAPSEEWIELFNSPDRMPAMESSGPWPVDPNIGGLVMFENVCITNNIDAPRAPELDTSLRGLLYFTNKVKNSKRCVPCSKAQMSSTEDEWNISSNTDSDLGHPCGMKGLHAMFAESVGDYNSCMADTDNHKSMIVARQNQSPSHVKQVHYFRDPTFLMQFNAHERESSLFDMLLTYLPHWHKFQSDGNFPFDSVISHSVQGCLTHSKNWLCEVLHQIRGFGFAKEIPWERKDTTLYCFKTIYYNQLEYQRDLNHEGVLDKAIMDDFRDELFSHLALPGPRDPTEIWKKDLKVGIKRPINIALYGNGNSEWSNLQTLVNITRREKTYHIVEFNVVEDFDELTVAEQATAFNLADAVVMASGDHLSNAIFSPDDTYFAEVGCSPKSLIGNPHFMSLIAGTYRHVSKCPDNQPSPGDKVCVSCDSATDFSMTEKNFRALLDDIILKHEQKVSFMSDS